MWFEMRSSTCLSLLLLSASSLPVQGLPAQQRAIFPSIGPLDDVLLFDAPAFVDGNNLVASVQAFVSLRQINLTPFLSAVQSALEDAFDLDIGNKVAQVEERLRLFAAIGQSGKDVNVKVGGCSAAASGSGASVGKTSKLPDLGMVLGSAPLGSCAQKTGALTGTVEDKGTIITDARKFENTIFASGPDGFGVISDIDDTVKITNTLDKLGVVKSTLLDDPTPVSGMPSLYASLSKSLATSAPPQFIYVSGSPFQLYPFLRSFISTSFPESRGPLLLQNLTLIDIPGLLDFAQSDGIFEYKSAMIQRIQRFYPAKKWLTVGDSTQKDPETYANAFRTFGPDFIACIWIRRVDGADNSDARFAEAFQGVPQDKFRVFSDGDIPGLASIDIKGGKC
ncbi:Phosphatidate phosphatase APP1 catalytic domain-containing protein [Pleurotus pulmonarius]